MSQPSNLYDLLRRLQEHAQRNEIFILTEAERQFLDLYLEKPDTQIHFKARRIGGTDENPMMEQSYVIAGEDVDVFSLLTEVCLQNPKFANLVRGANQFMMKHVPRCGHCLSTLADSDSWELIPHPTTNDK